MLTLVAFVVVLGPLIFFHELGHFVAAKLTGVRVEEFGFGWPPRIFKFWQSPSQLTVGSTPIVTPRNFELPENIRVGQHVAVITSHEQEGTCTLRELRVLDAKTDDLTPKREQTDRGMHIRGKLTALDPGTAYTLNWVPIGGFCRMTGEEDLSDPRSLAAQPKRERLAVLLGGPVMNLFIAILLFSVSFMSDFREPTEWRAIISAVVPDSPAAAAGLQTGDFVLKADGVVLEGVKDLSNYTEEHAGQTIVLTLDRDGTILELPVFARTETPPNEGPMGIGIYERAYEYIIRNASLPEALGMGLEQFWFSSKQIIQLPAMLISGEISAQEAVRPTGPVGISQVAGSAIERSRKEGSLFTILHFAGAISMALGITNLLPLPALDGGRILFVLIEAVRGRRIDPAKEGLIHLIGMMLLLGLMLIVTIQELANGVPTPFY
jgi:regulator of sigma E protease